MPDGEHFTNSNYEKTTIITTTNELNIIPFENKSSLEISKRQKTERNKSNENNSDENGLTRVDFYFNKKDFQKVLDVFNGYFRKSNEPIDLKHVDYLTYSLYKTVSLFFL